MFGRRRPLMRAAVVGGALTDDEFATAKARLPGG